MYINSIGYVQGSGSAFVQPSQTTNYNGSAGVDDGEETTCAATLTVGAQCPAGQTWNGSACVSGGCPAGQTWNGTQCSVGAQCASGYSGTPPNCTAITCPQGHSLQGGVCVPNGQQCVPYYCVGNDLYENNAQCQGSLNQACAWGCSGGGCLPAPEGTGSITAVPSLVRSGESARIEWTTEDMEPGTCSVIDDNPSIVNGGSGPNGSLTSSQLFQKTTFTLICTDLGGDLFTDNAVVNILPIFQEN